MIDEKDNHFNNQRGHTMELLHKNNNNAANIDALATGVKTETVAENTSSPETVNANNEGTNWDNIGEKVPFAPESSENLGERSAEQILVDSISANRGIDEGNRFAEKKAPSPNQEKRAEYMRSQERVDATAKFISEYANNHDLERTKDRYGWDRFEISDPQIRGELIDSLAKADKTLRDVQKEALVDGSAVEREIKKYVCTYGNMDDFISSIKDPELNERQQEEAKSLVLQHIPPHNLATIYAKSGNLEERGITQLDILRQETAEGMRENIYSYVNAGFSHRDIMKKAEYSFLLPTNDAKDNDAKNMEKEISYLRNSGFTGAEILNYSMGSLQVINEYFSDEPNSRYKAQQEFLDNHFTSTEILEAMEISQYDRDSIKKLVEKGVHPNKILKSAMDVDIVGSSDKNRVIHKNPYIYGDDLEGVLNICVDNGLVIDEALLSNPTMGDLLNRSISGGNNILSAVLNEISQNPNNHGVGILEGIEAIMESVWERRDLLEGEDERHTSFEEAPVVSKNMMRSQILKEWASQNLAK